jgi:hypothetical protein
MNKKTRTFEHNGVKVTMVKGYNCWRATYGGKTYKIDGQNSSAARLKVERSIDIEKQGKPLIEVLYGDVMMTQAQGERSATNHRPAGNQSRAAKE